MSAAQEQLSPTKLEAEPDATAQAAASLLKIDARAQLDMDRASTEALLAKLKEPSNTHNILYKGQILKTEQSKIPEIDWFSFETRVRQMMHDVVEPLTKKQFQTFDCFDFMRKQQGETHQKYQDILDQVEKVIKKNSLYQDVQGQFRQIEDEIATSKAVMDNEIRCVDRKLETWGARWSATQLQLNSCMKLEDQLKVTQRGVEDTVDLFKTKLTTQFKEMSEDFIKQLTPLDIKGHDIRFKVLDSLLKDVRDNQDATRFTFHFGERINGLEYVIKESVSKLQEEVNVIKMLQVGSVLPQEMVNQLQNMMINQPQGINSNSQISQTEDQKNKKMQVTFNIFEEDTFKEDLQNSKAQRYSMKTSRPQDRLNNTTAQENKKRATQHGKFTNYMDLLGSKGHQALSDNDSDKLLNSANQQKLSMVLQNNSQIDTTHQQNLQDSFQEQNEINLKFEKIDLNNESKLKDTNTHRNLKIINQPLDSLRDLVKESRQTNHLPQTVRFQSHHLPIDDQTIDIERDINNNETENHVDTQMHQQIIYQGVDEEQLEQLLDNLKNEFQAAIQDSQRQGELLLEEKLDEVQKSIQKDTSDNLNEVAQRFKLITNHQGSQIRNIEQNDKTSYFENQIVDLKQQIKGLEFMINHTMMDKINSEVEKFSDKIVDVMQTFHSVEELFKHDNKKMSRDKSDLTLRVDKFIDKISDLHAKFAKQDDTFQTLTQILQLQIEIEKIQYSLDLQDEKDKQQLSLYTGTQSSDNNGSPTRDKVNGPLSVDKNCMSCAQDGMKMQIQNAFKMACLQYTPSPIFFKGEQYIRSQLLNYKKSLIETGTKLVQSDETLIKMLNDVPQGNQQLNQSSQILISDNFMSTQFQQPMQEKTKSLPREIAKIKSNFDSRYQQQKKQVKPFQSNRDTGINQSQGQIIVRDLKNDDSFLAIQESRPSQINGIIKENSPQNFARQTLQDSSSTFKSPFSVQPNKKLFTNNALTMPEIGGTRNSSVQLQVAGFLHSSQMYINQKHTQAAEMEQLRQKASSQLQEAQTVSAGNFQLANIEVPKFKTPLKGAYISAKTTKLLKSQQQIYQQNKPYIEDIIQPVDQSLDRTSTTFDDVNPDILNYNSNLMQGMSIKAATRNEHPLASSSHNSLINKRNNPVSHNSQQNRKL